MEVQSIVAVGQNGGVSEPEVEGKALFEDQKRLPEIQLTSHKSIAGEKERFTPCQLTRLQRWTQCLELLLCGSRFSMLV